MFLVTVLDNDGRVLGSYDNVLSVATQGWEPKDGGEPATLLVKNAAHQLIKVHTPVRSATFRLAAYRDPEHPEKGRMCISCGFAA